MQSLVKQVDLQASSNVCIMCHYIQLKTLTAESFYWIVYIIINTRVWHTFQCCYRYCCYILYISYITLTKSLWSKMHLHSNSFIFMEFIITIFTVYCHTKICNCNHMLQRWKAQHANLQNLAWCIKLLLLCFCHTH